MHGQNHIKYGDTIHSEHITYPTELPFVQTNKTILVLIYDNIFLKPEAWNPNKYYLKLNSSLSENKTCPKFLLITKLMHFFMYLFINFISLHVSSIKCSSSGDRIVLIHHLVWLVCVSDCGRHTKQSLTHTNHTRWCINTIRSPDDEHLMLDTCREMKWINKYMKKCISLVINKNLGRESRSTAYKNKTCPL